MCSKLSFLFANVFLENMFYNTEISATAIYLIVKITVVEVNFEKRVCSLSLY